MSAAVRECRWCRRRQVVDMATDGRGGLVEGPLRCGCDAKRAAGLCIDCGNAVDGAPRRALRCAACKTIAHRRYCRRWRENHPERYESVQRRTNRKRRTKAERERRREYERSMRSTPEFRERRKARRRRIAVTEEGRRQRAEHRRRYKERYPERVKEQQDRANQKRAAAKREHMHLYATVYVGEGKEPTCRSCGSEVRWSGRGRPRLDCFTCRPERARV